MILRFAIVQNEFQQTNKTKINRINDNHIKFEVSLYFLGIWSIVRRHTAPARKKKKTCCKNAEKTLILDGPLLVEMVAILLVGPLP